MYNNLFSEVDARVPSSFDLQFHGLSLELSHEHWLQQGTFSQLRQASLEHHQMVVADPYFQKHMRDTDHQNCTGHSEPEKK